jgi:hypothetical protein
VLEPRFGVLLDERAPLVRGLARVVVVLVARNPHRRAPLSLDSQIEALVQPDAYGAGVAADETASEVGIPDVTDACQQRWLELSGLDRSALEWCLSDPEREVLERPPRWAGLTHSPEQRFLVAGGGEVVFVLVPSEAPGHQYTAITCVIRNRNELARALPPLPARRRLLVPLAIGVGVIALLALVGVGVYALVGNDNGTTKTDTAPKPAKELVATTLAAQKAPAVKGATAGRARIVHRARGNLPREVCASLRRGGRPAGHWCVEIANGQAVSSWYVPRGQPDRARFRRLCTGQAKQQKRC